MYKSMQTQLDTTRIHIATSDRPMYTSSSGFAPPSMGDVFTTFLFVDNILKEGSKEGGCQRCKCVWRDSGKDAKVLRTSQ